LVELWFKDGRKVVFALIAPFLGPAAAFLLFGHCALAAVRDGQDYRQLGRFVEFGR
jgi:hypothetical protein